MYVLKKNFEKIFGRICFLVWVRKVFLLFFVVGIEKIVVNIEYLEGWKYWFVLGNGNIMISVIFIVICFIIKCELWIKEELVYFMLLLC